MAQSQTTRFTKALPPSAVRYTGRSLLHNEAWASHRRCDCSGCAACQKRWQPASTGSGCLCATGLPAVQSVIRQHVSLHLCNMRHPLPSCVLLYLCLCKCSAVGGGCCSSRCSPLSVSSLSTATLSATAIGCTVSQAPQFLALCIPGWLQWHQAGTALCGHCIGPQGQAAQVEATACSSCPMCKAIRCG